MMNKKNMTKPMLPAKPMVKGSGANVTVKELREAKKMMGKPVMGVKKAVKRTGNAAAKVAKTMLKRNGTVITKKGARVTTPVAPKKKVY